MNDADDVQEFIATIEESVDLAKKKSWIFRRRSKKRS
jgi:hypothetical protein